MNGDNTEDDDTITIQFSNPEEIRAAHVADIIRRLKTDRLFREGYTTAWEEALLVLRDVVLSDKGAELLIALAHSTKIPPQVRVAPGVHKDVFDGGDYQVGAWMYEYGKSTI